MGFLCYLSVLCFSMPQAKYKVGQCVQFNPKYVERVDGTPMYIIGFHSPTKYRAKITHKKIGESVEFTAVIERFDRDTLPCKKG